MPLKSRDAQRVWGETVRQAIARDAESEAQENATPHLKYTLEVGDND